MNLDDQLREMVRPYRDGTTKDNSKQAIMKKVKKESIRNRWIYRLVLVSTCGIAILLFASFFASTSIQQDVTAPPFGNVNEHTKIEKVIILENENPQRQLNLKSIFYPFKESITTSEVFDDIIPILLSARERAIPWDGTFEEEVIEDIHFTFSNGEELYLKQSFEGEVSEHVNFLYDPNANMKYALSNEEWRTITALTDEIHSQHQFTRWTFIWKFLLVIIIIGISIVINKKEQKKFKIEPKKKQSSIVNILLTLVSVYIINKIINYFGTIHFGVGILILISVFIIEELISYSRTKQPIHWKFLSLNLFIALIFLILLTYF
ncbi:hypothetical protein [Ureibacillus sp. FSL E2-3493]|uniref:hypothetical protein n=1 Tax=Ureibacillus sp. FSL E2-3493 TaxID=2921367 RepID=UPI003119994F